MLKQSIQPTTEISLNAKAPLQRGFLLMKSGRFSGAVGIISLYGIEIKVEDLIEMLD